MCAEALGGEIGEFKKMTKKIFHNIVRQENMWPAPAQRRKEMIGCG